MGCLVSEHPSVLNVLTCFKHCTAMEKQFFTSRFHFSSLDNAGKRPFYSDLNSGECMLNHCLPMLGILSITREFMTAN